MYIIDTHVLLWWLQDSPKLSKEHQAIIQDQNSIVYFSSVNIWEVAIKSRLGKLDVPSNFLKVVQKESFKELHVSSQHSWQVRLLPDIHNDPFDRLLIAQAQIENLTLLTEDEIIPKYEVTCL